jgi:outer membrane protein assembly factor BamB
MWGPTPSQIYLDMYFGDGKFIYDGKLYSLNVGGIVYCYDVKTGELLWTYEANNPYSEFQLGHNWWLEPMFVADGKLYIGHAEHSANNPRPRGAQIGRAHV